MISMICFATCFGIVFDAFWYRCHFLTLFTCSPRSFFKEFSIALFMDFETKGLWKNVVGKNLFPDMFKSFSRPCSDIECLLYFGRPLGHFGALSVPCWLLWAPFWLNVGRFGFCSSTSFLLEPEAAKHFGNRLMLLPCICFFFWFVNAAEVC